MFYFCCSWRPYHPTLVSQGQHSHCEWALPEHHFLQMKISRWQQMVRPRSHAHLQGVTEREGGISPPTCLPKGKQSCPFLFWVTLENTKSVFIPGSQNNTCLFYATNDISTFLLKAQVRSYSLLSLLIKTYILESIWLIFSHEEMTDNGKCTGTLFLTVSGLRSII